MLRGSVVTGTGRALHVCGWIVHAGSSYSHRIAAISSFLNRLGQRGYGFLLRRNYPRCANDETPRHRAADSDQQPEPKRRNRNSSRFPSLLSPPCLKYVHFSGLGAITPVDFPSNNGGDAIQTGSHWILWMPTWLQFRAAVFG
jgi:hypothetical protein